MNIKIKTVVILLIVSMFLSCSQDPQKITEEEALERVKSFAVRTKNELVDSLPIVGTERAKSILRDCPHFYRVRYYCQEKRSFILIRKHSKNPRKFCVWVTADSFIGGKDELEDKTNICYDSCDKKERRIILDYSGAGNPNPKWIDGDVDIVKELGFNSEKIYSKSFGENHKYLKF